MERAKEQLRGAIKEVVMLVIFEMTTSEEKEGLLSVVQQVLKSPYQKSVYPIYV